MSETIHVWEWEGGKNNSPIYSSDGGKVRFIGQKVGQFYNNGKYLIANQKLGVNSKRPVGGNYYNSNTTSSNNANSQWVSNYPYIEKNKL